MIDGTRVLPGNQFQKVEKDQRVGKGLPNGTGPRRLRDLEQQATNASTKIDTALADLDKHLEKALG